MQEHQFYQDRQPGPDRRERSKNRNTPYSRSSASSGKERSEPKKPCRVLFVRNVDYSANETEVRDLFAPFGEIKTIFDLIAKRGLVFVTFYDLRASEAAKSALQGKMFKDRQIDIHYSTPKADDMGKRCEKGKNQGTLYLELRPNKPLDRREMRRYLEQYGQVKDVRIANETKAFAEYYDSREAEKAFDAINADGTYKDSRLSCKLMWDDPPKRQDKERSPPPYDRDRRDRGYDGGRRDRDSDYGRDRDYNYPPQQQGGLLDALTGSNEPSPQAAVNPNQILQLLQGGPNNAAAIGQILSMLGQQQGQQQGYPQGNFQIPPAGYPLPQQPQTAGYQSLSPASFTQSYQSTPNNGNFPATQGANYQSNPPSAGYSSNYQGNIQAASNIPTQGYRSQTGSSNENQPYQQAYPSNSAAPNSNILNSGKPEEKSDNPQLQQLAQLLMKSQQKQ